MSEYGWKFTIPEYILKAQETLDGLGVSAMAMSKAWDFSHYDFGGTYAAIKAYLESYESISKQVAQLSSLAKSILLSIDSLEFDELKNTTAMVKALRTVDWEWVADAYAEAFVDKESKDLNTLGNTASEEITPEIQAEIASDISEVLSNPMEMQSISRSKYLRWKEKYPGVAAFFIEILLPLLGILVGIAQFSMMIWQARPVKDSQVYEEPASTSTVVYNVTVENNLTVIGDVPYYYEVEVVNPDTGEVVIGYIYKGNVVAEERDNPEDHENEPETASGENATQNELVE